MYRTTCRVPALFQELEGPPPTKAVCADVNTAKPWDFKKWTEELVPAVLLVWFWGVRRFLTSAVCIVRRYLLIGERTLLDSSCAVRSCGGTSHIVQQIPHYAVVAVRVECVYDGYYSSHRWYCSSLFHCGLSEPPLRPLCDLSEAPLRLL